MKKIILPVLLIVVLGAFASFFLLFTSSHSWWKERDARVIYNQSAVDTASVYRGKNGEILVRFSEKPEENAHYIFYPSTGLIGIPSASQFTHLPMVAISTDAPVPAVMSNNQVKVDDDVNVVVFNEGFEFTALSGQRVRVLYKGA
jgi:hypothetical protein